MLQKYDRNASKHVYAIMTGNESWIYAHESESKQKSTVWVFQDEPNPTKVASARSDHFQAIDRPFFRKNWTCRNRTTRTTQNS